MCDVRIMTQHSDEGVMICQCMTCVNKQNRLYGFISVVHISVKSINPINSNHMCDVRIVTRHSDEGVVICQCMTCVNKQNRLNSNHMCDVRMMPRHSDEGVVICQCMTCVNKQNQLNSNHMCGVRIMNRHHVMRLWGEMGEALFLGYLVLIGLEFEECWFL